MSYKSELDPDFIELFRQLPERVRKTARKNYQIWKENPSHPGLEFKELGATPGYFSVRIGIGWRAIGILRDEDDTIVWFWVGSHAAYDNLIERL